MYRYTYMYIEDTVYVPIHDIIYHVKYMSNWFAPFPPNVPEKSSWLLSCKSQLGSWGPTSNTSRGGLDYGTFTGNYGKSSFLLGQSTYKYSGKLQFLMVVNGICLW